MPRFLFTLSNLQFTSLKELSEKTKVPIAEYIRQGIDQILINQNVCSGSINLGIRSK